MPSCKLTEALHAMENQTTAYINTLKDNPDARLRSRQAFYEKYGFGRWTKYGFGESELDFLEWEIKRGVLNPVGGSPWWSAVNLDFIYYAELAKNIFESKEEIDGVALPVQRWLDYLHTPSSQTWYMAHNTSIVMGYIKYVELATQENPYEQYFINEVLMRVLYAQEMVDGKAEGFWKVGEWLANPKLPSVDILVGLQDLYPTHYPLSKKDIIHVEHKGRSIEMFMEDFLDEVLISSQLDELFADTAVLLQIPELTTFVKNNKCIYPMVNQKTNKKKIAIIGGGIAGMTTAWELSNQANWKEKYDITIYQMGWRCGGKATTGVGMEGRIEERGIHMFQGWYENAFRMVKEVYHHIGEQGLNPEGAFQTWKDAFVQNPVTLMVEQDKEGNWMNWPMVLPTNNLEPGTGEPVSVALLLKEFTALGLQMLIGSPYQEDEDGDVGFLNEWLQDTFFDHPLKGKKKKSGLSYLTEMAVDRAEDYLDVEFNVLEDLLEDVLALSYKEDRKLSTQQIVTKSDSFMKELFKRTTADFLEKHNSIRRIAEIVQLGLACVKGVYSQVYNAEKDTYEWGNINGYDFIEWLKMNGASEEVCNSAIVRFLYKGTFANQFNGQPGTVAADVAVRMMLMIPSYKGSFVWNLKGGTGGSFTAPLYMALKDRGVSFEFFHKLSEVSYTEGSEIEQIIMDRQVDLKEGQTHYAPIVQQNGVWQWRATLDYTQLNPEQAKVLQEENIDLESNWSGWENVASNSLQKGKDFDIAILATSINPLKQTCKDIIQHKPAWKDMVDNVKTTPTLNVQFWLKENIEDLGMDLGEWGMSEEAYANTVIYEDLLYSWTSMTFVEPYEAWGKQNQPKQISYWCGTWPVQTPQPAPSETNYPQQELDKLKANTYQWMNEYMGWFWPKAVQQGAHGQEFDYNLLCDKDMDLSPMERFNQQHFVVNIDPSMQYVLAQPGTDKYRLKTDATSYDNLYFAGDWIDFGMNVGYMEGTVISGLQAAHKILEQHMACEEEELAPVLGIQFN
ncbi:NAD(P)-binding protein [Algivirga pacifica]|uniref:Amine oxidase domain-containing protein n=1 Tax=Algivirga pacifica TaxID=1162670 RepID=A0ABP9D560_9BACT